MRIALLGAGRIGMLHARLLAGLPDVELLIADVDPERARAAAAQTGGTALPTVEAAVAATDALAIAASTDTHADLVRLGLARGIPIFCEKPLARDLAGSIALAKEIEAAGAIVQLGFQRRFDAGYVEARRMVTSGELGTVYTVRLAGHDPAPPHEAYIPASGGLFRDFSVHDFDIIRWLLGAEVEEVYAVGGVRGFPMFATYGDVDNAVATMRMSDGVLVAMTASRHDPRGYDVRAELFGSKDSIAVGMDAKMPLRSVEPGVPAPAEAGWAGFIERFTPAYAAELRVFADVAAGRIPSPCTARDGVESLRIAEAATRSMAEHRPVALAEIPG
ncbi:MAG: Gfo/Idh/MocA family oxidoreductase [Chloroflexota bacterium]